MDLDLDSILRENDDDDDVTSFGVPSASAAPVRTALPRPPLPSDAPRPAPPMMAPSDFDLEDILAEHDSDDECVTFKRRGCGEGP